MSRENVRREIMKEQRKTSVRSMRLCLRVGRLCAVRGEDLDPYHLLG